MDCAPQTATAPLWQAATCVDNGHGTSNTLAATAIRRFDNKTFTKRTQVNVLKDRTFEKRREQNGIRCVQPRADELEVHRGFIFRPGRDLSRVDAPCAMFLRPTWDGIKGWLALSTVKEGSKGGNPFV